MKLGDPLDCLQFELRNGVMHLMAGQPSTPVNGQFWFSTGVLGGFVWNGTAGRPMDAALLTDGSIQNTALKTNPLDRQNHFGTQLAATISNLSTVVHGYTLDSFAAPVAAVNFGTQRITNAAQATQATDVPTWAQVQAYVQSSIQGQTGLKPPCRAYASGNVNLSAPGTNVGDGLTLAMGDRVAVFNQTTATQNNIYIWNGASTAMTVAPDSASGTQWIEGTEVLILEGTYGGAIFRQTTAGTIVIGTTALQFSQTFKINVYSADGITTMLSAFQFSVKFDAATMTTVSGSLGVRTDVFARKFSTTIITDGSNNAFNVVHGLGTTDIIVGVRDSMGNKIILDDNPLNSSTCTISFGSVMAAGIQYRVTVIG